MDLRSRSGNPTMKATSSIGCRRRAILAAAIPVVEVHITNIHAREEFRRVSLVSKVAKAVICGFGIEGYALAITGLAAVLGTKAQS